MWDYGQRLLQQAIDRSFGMSANAAAELSRMLFTANQVEPAAILRRLAAMHPADRMARFIELTRQMQRLGLAPGAALGGAAAGGSPQQPSFF